MFIAHMGRVFLFASVAGKIGAWLLWSHPAWRWLAIAAFFGPDLLVLFHLLAPSAQGICPVITRFETSAAEIWLTIDDGPDGEDTPRILDLLDRHGARVTFFPIGERAARRPDLIADLLRRGHDVGHHTHTHPLGLFWCASPARLRRELDDGLAALRTGGAAPRWFRGPVGIKNLFLQRELTARGLRCVGWNVRSHDSTSQNPATVAARVMKQVRPGAIVLMHEGPALRPQVRVRALELLLAALAHRGFRCVLPRAEQLR